MNIEPQLIQIIISLIMKVKTPSVLNSLFLVITGIWEFGRDCEYFTELFYNNQNTLLTIFDKFLNYFSVLSRKKSFKMK